MNGVTKPLTGAEIDRLKKCSICNIEPGFFVCQNEKCPNKDKLLYCNKCGKDNHSHGAVRIQNLQMIKSLEWEAIQRNIEKIENSYKVGY